MKVERKGECNRCGDCCQGCEYFTQETKICSIYGTEGTIYSKGCNIFPDRPSQLRFIPNCSYIFIVTDENGNENTISNQLN